MNKNLPLIIGVSLPVLFIAILAVVVYLPTNFKNPEHNFLYTENSYDLYRNEVVIKGEHIEFSANNLKNPEFDIKLEDNYVKEYPKIYLYDFVKKSSYEIPFEEAQKYTVVRGPSSPDGYSIVKDYGHDGIFEIFGSYGNNEYFISSPDGIKRKLIGINPDYYDLNVIGWIK